MGYQPTQPTVPPMPKRNVCDNCCFFCQESDRIVGTCIYQNKVVCRGEICSEFKDKKQYPVTAHKIQGNISDADVVIVYGAVQGNISECQNVIVINGDVNGNITKCINVAGLLADTKQDTFQGSRSTWNQIPTEKKKQYRYVDFKEERQHISKGDLEFRLRPPITVKE